MGPEPPPRPHQADAPRGRFVCLTYVRDGGPLRRRALARSRDLFGMELFEPARLEALVREAGLALIGVERAGLLAVLAVLHAP